MTKILVGGGGLTTSQLASVLVGCPVVIVGIFMTTFSLVGLIFVALGGVLVLAGFGGFLMNRAKRQWAEVNDKGFLLTGAGGERFVCDDDVSAMAITRDDQVTQGALDGQVRRCFLWLGQDGASAERLVLKTLVKPKEADPLQPLMIRIENRLLAQAKVKRESGELIDTNQWRMNKDEISLRHHADWLTAKLRDVIAIDFDRQTLCVWVAGSDEVWGKLPEQSANSYILYQLLCEEVAKHPRSSRPLEPNSLGRVLFERPGKPAPGAVILIGFVGLVSLFFFVMGFLAPFLFFASGLFFAFVPPFALLVFATKRSLFRCHEFGVSYKKLWGVRTLLFKDVQKFTCSARALYVNFSYAGTTFALTLEPFLESGARKVKYAYFEQKPDESVERLRYRITDIVAVKLTEELAKQGRVQWTRDLCLTQAEIEYRQRRFLRPARLIVIPYVDIAKHDLDAGRMRLWTHGNAKPVLAERCDRVNFYPGYQLLQEKLTSR